MADLTFAQTYLLASKVRTKLTKEANSPKASLRNLVVQANMLDNIMEYIHDETEKRTKVPPRTTSHVSFDVPIKPSRNQYKTAVMEYEVDEDSDDDEQDAVSEYSPMYYYDEREVDSDEDEDDDDDEDWEDEYSSSSDSDDYYYSDEEDEEDEPQPQTAVDVNIPRTVPSPSFRELPSLNLQSIQEEDGDDESYSSDSEEEEEQGGYHGSIMSLPELTNASSFSDEEVEEHDLSTPHEYLIRTNGKEKHPNAIVHHHDEEASADLLRQETPHISLEHVF